MDGFSVEEDLCRVDGDIRHRIPLQIITEPHRYIQVPVCMGDIVIDMNRQQVGDRITDCTSIQPGIDMTVLLNQVAAGTYAGSRHCIQIQFDPALAEIVLPKHQSRNMTLYPYRFSIHHIHRTRKGCRLDIDKRKRQGIGDILSVLQQKIKVEVIHSRRRHLFAGSLINVGRCGCKAFISSDPIETKL